MGGTREAAKGKVSEEWVGKASVLGFGILPPPPKRLCTQKNLAGALHAEAVRCIFRSATRSKRKFVLERLLRRTTRGTDIPVEVLTYG